MLVPHANEFLELTGITPSLLPEERIKVVEKQAKILGATILLKGRVDIISNGIKTFLNNTGSSLAHRRRHGDTDTLTAGCAAEYLNGLKILAKSEIISHIINALPFDIKAVLSKYRV